MPPGQGPRFLSSVIAHILAALRKPMPVPVTDASGRGEPASTAAASRNAHGCPRAAGGPPVADPGSRRFLTGRLLWLAIFAVALLPRLIFFLIATLGSGRVFWAPDSLEYDLLGRNLARHGVFSQSLAPPFTPDLQRTPLFPLQIALAYLVAGYLPPRAVTLAVAGTVAIGALTSVLLARLVTWWAGRRAGLVAGLLLAFDLTSIVYASMLLSEVLFTLLLTAVLLALARYCRQADARLALLAGAGLGLATLTRPIGVFLVVALAPVFFLARGRRGWPRALRDLVLCALALGVLVLPWSWRTRAAGGTDVVATQAAINAYFHRGALIAAWGTGRTSEDVRAEMEAAFQQEAAARGWSEEEQVRVMQERAARLIAEHRLLYLRLQLRGMLQLLGPETDALFDVLGLRAAPHQRPARGVYTAWKAVGMVQLAVVYALAMVGALALARRRRWAELALLTLPVAYFLAVSGPEAYARFRVPVMPAIVVLASLVVARWPPRAERLGQVR